MERREASIPHTRQKSSEGHRRLLPNLGASGSELSRINLNWQLDPDAPVQAVRDHLLKPEIYGPSFPFRSLQGQSRNSGPRSR